MKWIKASERLPERPKDYSGNCQIFIRNTLTGVKKVVYRGPRSGHNSLLERSADLYEWLDESKDEVREFVQTDTSSGAWMGDRLSMGNSSSVPANPDDEKAAVGYVKNADHMSFYTIDKAMGNAFLAGCTHVRGQQQVDAVAFGIWLSKNYIAAVEDGYIGLKDKQHHTTTDLYALFTARHPTPKPGSQGIKK